VLPARGNTADNKAFPALREHDRKLGLPTESYCGDRAYDDTDIHERLEAEGLHCYMKLRSFRIEKKDANKGRWLELIADSDYEEAQDECYKVERTFGWAKSRHGLERRRYLGLDRYHIQSLLTFMVTNAKRLVKLLTGITFRPQAKGRRAERLVPVYSALPWV